jgi:hypothetical protein
MARANEESHGMSEPTRPTTLQDIMNAITQLADRFDGLEVRVHSFETDVRARFAAMESRAAAMETRFAAIESRFAAIETRFQALDTRLELHTVMMEQILNRVEGRVMRHDQRLG